MRHVEALEGRQLMSVTLQSCYRSVQASDHATSDYRFNQSWAPGATSASSVTPDASANYVANTARTSFQMDGNAYVAPDKPFSSDLMVYGQATYVLTATTAYRLTAYTSPAPEAGRPAEFDAELHQGKATGPLVQIVDYSDFDTLGYGAESHQGFLPAGTYTVAYWIGSVAESAGFHFAFQLLPAPGGVLTGTVFRDLNGNQVPAGNQPMESVQVYVDANNNGVYDRGETYALTNGEGEWMFYGVKPGTYVIREVVPTGYHRTTPAGPWPTFGKYVVTISAATQSFDGLNFGDSYP